MCAAITLFNRGWGGWFIKERNGSAALSREFVRKQDAAAAPAHVYRALINNARNKTFSLKLNMRTLVGWTKAEEEKHTHSQLSPWSCLKKKKNKTTQTLGDRNHTVMLLPLIMIGRATYKYMKQLSAQTMCRQLSHDKSNAPTWKAEFMTPRWHHHQDVRR